MIEKIKSLADEKLKKYNYEYDQYLFDELVKKMLDQDIQTLVSEIQNMQDTKEDFARVKEIVDKIKNESIQRIKDRQEKEKAKEEKKKAKREWTKDEYALLSKA